MSTHTTTITENLDHQSYEERVAHAKQATAGQVMGAEVADLMAPVMELVDWQRRQLPATRRELLVLAVGFYSQKNLRSDLATRAVTADAGDPEHPDLLEAIEALDSCHRYVAASHTQYGIHLALDGFDLETGVAGVEIDGVALAKQLRPKAVLILTGPWADLQAAGVLAGSLVHREIPVYRHDVLDGTTDAKGKKVVRKIGARDPVLTKMNCANYIHETTKVLSPRAETKAKALPQVVRHGEDRLIDTGETMPLAGEWKPATLGSLPCERFVERRWTAAELKATPARFGSCIYWRMEQAEQHGVADIDPDFASEDVYPLSIDLCPSISPWEATKMQRNDPEGYRRYFQPLTFSQARDDYWRNLLNSGVLYGMYKQQVRQYVRGVIGPEPDGLAPETHCEMERRSNDWCVGGTGQPEQSNEFNQTPSGYWDDRDVYHNTGASESTPRHWVDLSPFLERGDASPVQEAQHKAVAVKPWLESSDGDEAEAEDVEFRASILAWQDEYDRLGSWAGDASQAERDRCLARMVPTFEDRARRLGRGREDVEAAWIEYALDAADQVRELIPLVETCEVLSSDDPNVRTVESLRAEFLELASQFAPAAGWLRELEASRPEFVGPRRCEPIGIWSDLAQAGAHCRNALARRETVLRDPEGFLRQELALEALDACPEWAPALAAGDLKLAEAVLGDLMPTPSKPTNFGMRMARRKLARKLLESGAKRSRAKVTVARRLYSKAASRKRRMMHDAHVEGYHRRCEECTEAYYRKLAQA